ncbi:Hypothetical_protein [Hexamita inflata]|uniref:Hypothetical_protein n=1 Tax=Hexamita inflata TaxID=28002 RepID=A0AA86U7J7_9EUKA|nr:Hypothetical protein HINF_LOCUS33720 [Hexamita inflata]
MLGCLNMVSFLLRNIDVCENKILWHLFIKYYLQGAPFDWLSRVNEHEQEETDQRVMTLFPALNLEALRVAADTLVPRFIPAIPKIVTKITSEVNNDSSSAELTQVV